MATAISSSPALISRFFGSSQVRLAAGGWIFFITENAVLSENRNLLIEQVFASEDRYRMAYGSLSTLAVGTILYSYVKLTRTLATVPPTLRLGTVVASWASLSLGAVMASQALPKMQIPVGFGNGGELRVLCPFDFAHDRNKADGAIFGVERVTRHAGLWSLGLVGVGNGLVSTSLPLAVWWMGPALVAFLGGLHTDSRYRRGLGGTLDPWYESQTSQVPFAALVTGKQGNLMEACRSLANEIKPLNAALATGVATLWVTAMSRGRLRPKF